MSTINISGPSARLRRGSHNAALLPERYRSQIERLWQALVEEAELRS